jgi:filamentous hemagglutinin
MTSKRRARKGTFRRAVSAVTLVAFVASPAGVLAGPIADPTAPIGFRPTVTTAPSGASVVNIVAPTAAGTSHNKYSGFDVAFPGVVLNNSLGAGTSALAGSLGANPNLTGAFATVILNEVTGNGASSLAGPLEVFGHAASVIIANPNGVACAGCSFLNAPRVTLTSGAPFYNGSVLGLNVTGGTVGVAGAGLDATGVRQLDLVGGNVAFTAPVNGAQQLNLLAGKLAYDYASGIVTPVVGASGGGYAIDASALGSLSAGRIHLQATDAGVGVRALGGVAATAEDIVISASGEVRIGNVTAARDLVVSAGAFQSGAIATVGRDFTAAVGALTNEGSISAGRDVAIDATGGVTNRGSLAAENALTVTAASISNLAGAILSRAGALSLAAAGAIDNSAGSLSGAQVSLQGASLANANGFVFAEGSIDLNFAGPLSNAAGQILAVGDLDVAAGAMDNRGGIALGRDTRLNVASLDNRANGRVAADRDLALSASGAVNNSGGLLSANRDAVVSADQITNQGGSLTAVGNLALTATASLTGTGAIGANDAVTLRGGTLAPGGTLDAGSLDVEAQAFNNAASARIFGDAAIRGGSFSNAGSLGSAGAVTISVAGAATNSGVVAANTDLAIDAAAIANLASASLLALGNATLRAATVTNTGGTIQAGSDLAIETQTLRNQRGPITTVYSATDARGSARGLFGSRPTGDLWESWSQVESTPPAQLLAGGNLTLAIGTGLNDASLMAAGGDIAIAGDAFTNQAHQLLITTVHTWYRWKSKLLGRKETVQDVYYAWNGTPSTVQAGSDLKLALAGALNNSGNLIANSVNAQAATINTGIFDYYAQTPPTVEPRSAIDLSLYGSLPTGPNQLFTERRDPASRFLIGVDPSLPLSNLVLLSPEYFASLLGQAEAATRFYADPLAEAALLRSAALAQTGRAFFVPEAKTDEEQRRALYEAALRFAQSHPGLVLGEAFTDELIAQLDAPILWYVRNAEGILVPVVYLPTLARENLANVQGGLIQASEIQLAAIKQIDNSGFIAGQRITLDADSVINQKRSADVGHIVKHEKDYWYEITGSTMQPGGFISAAELQINANRLTSISGEFYEKGEDASGRLKEQFGANAAFSQNQDRLDVQTHQYEKDPLEQVVVAAVVIAVSMWVGPMIAAALNAAAETAAVAAISDGLVAGTITSGAEALAVQEAVYAGFAFAPASVATAAVSTGLTGMATSSASQLLTTGEVDLSSALKAGLTSGLTAGVTQGFGQSFDNQTLLGGQQIPGGVGELVKAGSATTDLGDKLVGYTLRAAVTGGVNKGVYGDEAGSFGTAFVNSWAASASADAAYWVGGALDRTENPVGNIGAHALVGCAAAAAAGNSCGAGAFGAATAAAANPLLDEFTTKQDADLRKAQLAALLTAASGLAANAAGQDIATALGAAQNETINNYLQRAQISERFAQLRAAQSNTERTAVMEDWQKVWQANREELRDQCGQGASACRAANLRVADDIVDLESLRGEIEIAALSAKPAEAATLKSELNSVETSLRSARYALIENLEGLEASGLIEKNELGLLNATRGLVNADGFVAAAGTAVAGVAAGTVQTLQAQRGVFTQIMEWFSARIRSGQPSQASTPRSGAAGIETPEIQATAGSIRNVNPKGGIDNCVNCAIATDATLAGKPASALLGRPVSIGVLERYFGDTFKPVSGRQEIEQIMTAAGPGARAIVFGSRGAGQVGHVFNVANQRGTIRFLDGQTGKAASFRGYTSFELLRTN